MSAMAPMQSGEGLAGTTATSAPIQRASSVDSSVSSSPVWSAKKGSVQGLPTSLRAGVEQLSGVAMDDVRVHYNSTEPTKIQAQAYAQGTDIHLGAGHEKHLGHEAWHVVQQKRGRVRATTQAFGLAVNDQPDLEHEATMMGRRASRIGESLNWMKAEMMDVGGRGLAANRSHLRSSFSSTATPQRARTVSGPNIVQAFRTGKKDTSKELDEKSLETREVETPMDLEEMRFLYVAAPFRGKLYGVDNPLQYTTIESYAESKSLTPVPLDGKMLFALSADNKLYTRYEQFEEARADSFTHANFMSGVAIKTAGELYMKKGTVLRMNNESGHYRPTGESLEWLLDYFEYEKVDTSKTTVSMLTSKGKFAYPATEYNESIEKPAPLSKKDEETEDHAFQTYDRFKRGKKAIDLGVSWRDETTTFLGKVQFMCDQLREGNAVHLTVWYATKKQAPDKAPKFGDSKIYNKKRRILFSLKNKALSSLHTSLENRASKTIGRSKPTRGKGPHADLTGCQLTYQEEVWTPS